MSDLGYRGEVVFVSSAHVQPAPGSGLFPAPQYRDRMYVVWTRNDVPRPDLEFRPSCWCPTCERVVEAYQWWKPRTKAWPAALERWGKFRTQYLYRCGRCHTPAEPLAAPAWTAIDWTIAGQRVGDRSLRPATLARIRRGLEKFGHLGPLVIPLDRPGDLSKRAKPVDSPLDTLTGRQDKALAWSWRPFGSALADAAHSHEFVSPGGAPAQAERQLGAGRSSLPGPTARSGRAAGATAFLVKNYGGADEARYRAHRIDRPLGAVTAADSQAIVTAPSFYVKNYGEGSDPSMAHDVADPLGALTAQDHHAVVNMPFTVAYYGHGQERPADAPIGAVTSHDRYGVAVPDDPGRLEDCRFRMLEPHELGRAMAFPDDYKVAGNKRQRVRQYGNAVTPPVTAMLTGRLAEALA